MLLTTGRKLAEGFPDGIDSAAVLLDGEDTYRRFADQDVEIYWGAYLGTPDEILISGKAQGRRRRNPPPPRRSATEERLDHGYVFAEAQITSGPRRFNGHT